MTDKPGITTYQRFLSNIKVFEWLYCTGKLFNHCKKGL